VVIVTEEEILAAVRSLLWREKLVVEPSGAVAYAAFMSGKVSRDLPSAAVLSGGNISLDYMRQVVG
jgi:threonine dehydratase